MNLIEHNSVDNIVFEGRNYNDVHKWMDEFFNDYHGSEKIKHWLKRHHLQRRLYCG